MRTVWTVLFIVVGFLLQIVSYFFLAAPLGTPATAAHSEPRLPFAPTLFILGVVLVFLAAVVYELLPERVPEGSATRRAP